MIIFNRFCLLVYSIPPPLQLHRIQRFSIALRSPPCWLSQTLSSSSLTSGRQSGLTLFSGNKSSTAPLCRSHDVVLTGEALLTFSFATNLFHKLVLVSDRSTKTWLIETFLQAMEQTEIREEEVRIYFQSIRPSPPLSINFSQCLYQRCCQQTMSSLASL